MSIGWRSGHSLSRDLPRGFNEQATRRMRQCWWLSGNRRCPLSRTGALARTGRNGRTAEASSAPIKMSPLDQSRSQEAAKATSASRQIAAPPARAQPTDVENRRPPIGATGEPQRIPGLRRPFPKTGSSRASFAAVFGPFGWGCLQRLAARNNGSSLIRPPSRPARSTVRSRPVCRGVRRDALREGLRVPRRGGRRRRGRGCA
jgi:hypothetical protein